MQKITWACYLEHLIFLRRLSLFNFITIFYFSVLLSYFDIFHLCGSFGIVTIPSLVFTPCFQLLKFFRLCSFHVIKLTFFTTSQIRSLTFVDPPLGFFKAFNCKVTILYAVYALRGQVFISSRVGITLLVLFLLLRLFFSFSVSRSRTIVF